MSFLPSQASSPAVADLGGPGGAEQIAFAGLAVLAVVAFALEVVQSRALEARRRAGPFAPPSAGEGEGVASSEGLLGPSALQGPIQVCKSLAPEACGLVLCLALAGALLAGGGEGGPASTLEEDKEIWETIRNEWPVLVTADSLLGLRALLRILLLFSAVFRTEEALASPLAGEPGCLLLLAAISRVLLLALSPQDVYHLDGPLGGIMAMALEVASLGPLIFLAAGKYLDSCRMPPWPNAAAVAAAAALACRIALANHLILGGPGDAFLDVLFSLGEMLELAAALAFLLRVLVTAGGSSGSQGPFAAFAHFMLPAQQLLSAYFLLTAWGGTPLEGMPALVGAGRPFELLQLGGAAQVGTYAVAGVAQLVLAGAAEKEAAVPAVQV